MATVRFLARFSEAFVRWTCGPSLGGLSVRACWIQSGDDERVWGGNGKTQNSLAAFTQAVYHEEKGHGLLCPEMNQKTLLRCLSLQGINSLKSEQINHLEWNEQGEVMRICGGLSVCMSAFLSVHQCMFSCPCALQDPRFRLCRFVWRGSRNRRHEEADGSFRYRGVSPEEAWLRRWIRLPVQTSQQNHATLTSSDPLTQTIQTWLRSTLISPFRNHRDLFMRQKIISRAHISRCCHLLRNWCFESD